MKAEWGEVRIKRDGQIKEQMVPGFVVGGGLAVTQFPNTDSTGQTAYGITLARFGLLLPQPCVFFSWRLAVRCAEELIRVVSFEGPYEPGVRARVAPKWPTVLEPICQRYTRLDDMWEYRRVTEAQREGQDSDPDHARRMAWDGWARRN